MRDRTLRVLINLFAVIGGIYTGKEIYRSFFIEDTAWMVTTPMWVLVLGAILVFMIPFPFIYSWIFSGSEIDQATRDMLHEITRRKGMN